MVDEILSSSYRADILLVKCLSENNIALNNEDEYTFGQLIDRFEPFNWVYGKVRSGAPIVIWFGPQNSSLKAALIEHLTVEDITLILFKIEDHLWQWLDLNFSLTVASLILQPTAHIEQVITRSHNYSSVHSILVRCIPADLSRTQRFVRSYRKVDGVFDDDTRLMIKLVADLTLLSEELGDQQREGEKNEIGAQRNYDRALKLCVLVQKF